MATEKHDWIYILAGIILALTARPAVAAPSNQPQTFQLTAAAFRDRGRMPVVFARREVPGGQNISPSLSWSSPPRGTKSLALLCLDLHPVARRWIHWLAINLPGNVNHLPRNASGRAMPAGCRELNNSFGFPGWGGPQPPPGTGVHEYIFSLYALSCERINSEIKNEAQFLAAIKGKVLGVARLTGLFAR